MDNIFERVEKKYMMSALQYEKLMEKISIHLVPAEYGKSTVCSLYLDTPDDLLIRNSIDAKVYKEKLRIRSYSEAGENDEVFFEIKKKYKGIVYKRREQMKLNEIYRYISTGRFEKNTQITRELDYAMKFYGMPVPKMFIAYERLAFNVKNMPELRITFDYDIRYRDTLLEFKNTGSGKRLLEPGTVLMEFKTERTMPLWLSHTLDELKIYHTSFSKYAAAYRDKTANAEGEYIYA